MTLFEEADTAAAARRQPKFVEEDLRIAFRQIQRRRLPDLSAEEFDALYSMWRDGHDGGRIIERRAQLARVPRLLRRRDQLAEARDAAAPERRAVLTGLLHELTTEIASLLEPRGGRAPLPGDATWDPTSAWPGDDEPPEIVRFPAS